MDVATTHLKHIPRFQVLEEKPISFFDKNEKQSQAPRKNEFPYMRQEKTEYDYTAILDKLAEEKLLAKFGHIMEIKAEKVKK